MTFYHPNFAQFDELCKSGFYLGRCEDYALVRSKVPMPALLAFAGYPLSGNQLCFRHKGSSGSAMSIYRHENDGSWLFNCRNQKCGANGDVTEMWYQMVRYSGLAPLKWTKAYAAGDLLQRVKAGEIDVSIINLGDYVGNRPARGLSHPQDDYGRRLRRLIQERERILLLGGCALPTQRVRLTVREAVAGLFPENGYLLITPKQGWHDIKLRDEWLSDKLYLRGDPPVPERSFISSSYLTRSDVNCSYAAFEGGMRRWLVIESDTGSLEEQFWIHHTLSERYPLACVCYSGGKSLHGWYLVEGWTEERCFELYAEAIRLGVSDSNTWRICQLVRLPGGLNRKTMAKQKILLWKL